MYVQPMWIKICGVNDPSAAREIAELRPDAIGLNFYKGTPRRVSREVAAEIAAACPAGVAVIGVFVEPSAEEIRETAAECRLDGIQIHSKGQDDAFVELGDLSPASRGKTAARNPWKIRAFQIGSEGLAPVARYLDGRPAASPIDACLIDAKDESQFGGTGKTAPWDVVRDRVSKSKLAAPHLGGRAAGRECRRGDRHGSAVGRRCGQRRGVRARRQRHTTRRAVYRRGSPGFRTAIEFGTLQERSSMADVHPFRGWKYDLAQVGSLSDVTAPPYDVIGPDQQRGFTSSIPATSSA